MKQTRLQIILILCMTVACIGQAASGDEVDFKGVTLKDLLGPRWSEFERAFASLCRDPRNDQAFRIMSVVLGETKTEMKIAPYLRALLDQNPKQPGLRIILGRVYKDLLQDPSEACRQFEIVLETDPKDFFVHYQLAAVFAKQGPKAFEKAAEHFSMAAKHVEASRQSVDLRTRIYREMGDLFYGQRHANPELEKQAYGAWDRMASGIRRFDSQTYEELARIYRSHSLWTKVTETYERYFETLKKEGHKPDNVTLCRMETRTGEAHEKAKKDREAIASYENALQYLDENAWQRRKLEKQIEGGYRRLGEIEAYRKQLADRVAREPESLAAKQILMRMLERTGKLDEAITVVEEARQQAPHSVPLLNAAERLYRKTEQHEKLAAILRAKIKLSPENFRTYLELAELHLQQKQPDEARKVLSELENSPSLLAEKFWLLGEAYRRFKMPEPAFALYQRAIRQGGVRPEHRLAFCDFCLRHEDFVTEANRQAKTLCTSGTLSASGHVQLAEIFRQHNQLETAHWILGQGIQVYERKDPQSRFLLYEAQSRLAQQLGKGYRWLAVQSTLSALLEAPTLYFKKKLNDRFVTLLSGYGYHRKLLYGPKEEAQEAAGLFGGDLGKGIAPWVDFLIGQANAREQTDLWMLLGQIHETVKLETEIPPAPDAQEQEPRRVRADITEAQKCYQKVVDMEFQNLAAHVAFARVLADPSVDEYEKAVTEFAILAVLNPIAKWAYKQSMGDLYTNAGEFQKASDIWEEITSESPGEPNLLLQVSMRLFRAKQIAKALELAEQAARLNPHAFRYQIAYASLLSVMAEQEQTVEHFEEAAKAMKRALELAESSPQWRSASQRVRTHLLHAFTNLARASFVEGQFPEAKKHYQTVLFLLKEREDPASKKLKADTQIQVLRCDEALGKLTRAVEQYADIVNKHPDLICWVSPRMTVPANVFLQMKREGHLREGKAARPTQPKTGSGVQLARLQRVVLHDRVESAGMDDQGSLHVKGRLRFHQIWLQDGKRLTIRRDAADSDVGPVHFCAAGKKRMLFLQDNQLWALTQEESVWEWKSWGSPPAQEKPTRIETVLANDKAVILVTAAGIQALSSADGSPLWQLKRLQPRCVLDADTVVVLSKNRKGGDILEVVDPGKGSILGSATLSATVVWHDPVLAGNLVLLMDSLEGQILSFYKRDERELFAYETKAMPILPLLVSGDAVLVHYLEDKVMRVAVIDAKTLRLRHDVSLQPKEGDSLDSLSSLASSPLIWRNFVLYHDAKKKRTLCLDSRTGSLQAVRTKEQSLGTFDQWFISGDHIVLVRNDGEIVFGTLNAK